VLRLLHQGRVKVVEDADHPVVVPEDHTLVEVPAVPIRMVDKVVHLEEAGVIIKEAHEVLILKEVIGLTTEGMANSPT